MAPGRKAERSDHLGPGPAAPNPERERIRGGLVELVGERGYSDTDLDDLLRHLEIDAAAFERHYATLDACFADVWERYTQEFFKRALTAFISEETWRDGMRAQAWELFRFLSEDPLRARICLVEVNFGGELVQASRDVFMGTYIDLIHLGRHEREGQEDTPRARAEGVIGAIWEQAAVRVSAGQLDSPELVPQMLYLLFTQYLGPEAAQEELQRGREEVARFRRGEL